MALSAAEIDAKYAGAAATAPVAGGPVPKAGTFSVSEIDKKYGKAAAAPGPSAPSVHSSSQIDSLYGKRGGTVPAETPNAPMEFPAFLSLPVAFPSPAVQTTTPTTTDHGTLDDVKNITGALLSIPKTLYDNEVHPSSDEQSIEHFTNVGEGTPLAPVTAIPNFVKNMAMRFINPVLKPFAEDVATAIAGNLPDSNPLAIRKADLPYTAVMKKSSVQIIGDTAQAVLAAYTPSLLARSAVATVGGPIKTALLSGAKAGAEGGLYFGVAQAASSGSKDPAEIGSTIFLNVTGGAILGAITSGAIPVAKGGYQALTKDIIHTYGLPQKVYIEADKIRSIFQTGDRISADELQLVKELGLDTRQYGTAVRDGLTVEIPTENLITITDKPYWAKLKSFVGLKPTDTSIATMQGQPRLAPYGLLESGDSVPGAEASKTPQEQIGGTPALGDGQSLLTDGFNQGIEAPAPVLKALSSPINTSLLERIQAFDAPEASAFGRNLIQQITEAAGLHAPGAGDVLLPKNVVAINRESSDGRPAQFNNGNIEIFVPNVVKDIAGLAAGAKIQAHEGVHTAVYEKKPNESFEDLAVRYVQDIILHEAAHQKTMTLSDTLKTQQLTKALNAAKLEHNQPAIISARQELTAHMQELEVRANDHLKTNREALTAEYLQPGPATPDISAAPRAINHFERQALGIPKDKVLTRSERTLLRQRIKARAQGSREGFSAGKKEGTEQTKTELVSRYSKTIEEIRNRQKSALEKRKALIDYAQILPFRERGKFLKAVNNTNTDLEFEGVLNRMRAASKASERAGLIKEIVKELKGTVVKKRDGLPNAKFAYNQQKTLNEIRAVQKMMYQEAQMKITTLVSDWQTQHPDDVLPDDVLHQIEVLKTAGIKDQTVSELASTLSAIQSIKETGRTKKELERATRNEKIQQAKDGVLKTVTGGKPLPSDALSIKTRKAKAESFLKTYGRESLFGWEELLDKMSQEDKGSKPYESYLSRFAGDKASTSFNDQNKGELTSINQVNDLVKKSYDIEKKTDVLKTLGDLQEQHDFGEVKHTDGKMRTLSLSRGEAMQYWMWHQDDALDNTFAETLHWGPEVWEKVESLLTPEDKKMAKSLLDWYGDYYKGVNEVFSKEYGIDLPFNPNYSPVHRAIDVAIPENVLLAQEIAKYATAKNGSLKDRVKNGIDLKTTDAFENVTRHITKMEHYKAWSDTMFNFRRVFGDKQVRTAISDFVGDPYLKLTDNFLNDMARDGVAREKVVAWVDGVRKNATKALLGLNLKVGIKQLTGVLNYGIEVPTGSFFAGLTDFWTDPVGKAAFLFDHSPTLEERFGDGFERDLKFAIEKGYDKKLAGTKNLSEAMFIPIRNADKFTVYMGSWSAYRWAYKSAIKAGKTPEEAQAEGIRQAENITNRVQESSRLDTLAQLQREGSWAKLFTMFQSQPSKYLRIMMNAGRNYRRGRTSAASAAKRIAWAWFIVPFFYNLVADQFIDKKYRESSGGLVMRTLLGPLTEPLIFGQMVQQIYGWTQGENFGYEPSPVFGFMDDVAKAVQKFTSDDAVDGTTYLLDAAGKLTGVPSTIATKPIRNATKAPNDGGSAPSGSF